MKGLLISLLFFCITYSSNGQEYAKKQNYLVDSLDLSTINKDELLVIDSCLTVFHSVKGDSSKISAINYKVERS